MTTANLSVRGPAVFGLLATAMLVLGLGLWAATATLSGAVVTRGRVEPDQGRLPVQHPDGGVVAEIRVAEGAQVSAGEVLLVLDGAALRHELAVTDLRLNELLAHSARLRAERDGLDAVEFPAEVKVRAANDPDLAARIEGQQKLFAARRDTQREMQAQLAQRIVQIRAQIAGLTAQRQAVDLQLRLIGKDLAAQQGLFKRGLVPQASILALQREKARLSGQAGELQAAQAVAEGQITEIGIEDTALALRRKEAAATELREIEPLVLELQARRAALAERIARLDIRAPVSGRVMGLVLSAPGEVLRAAETALVIVPEGRPLVVTAGIAATDIDDIAPGQRADLAFPGLAGRDSPRLAGRVILVSPDAVTDQSTGAARFLVRVEIAPQELARLGDRRLVPGMPVDVFLATRARTPLTYLIEPFSAYFRRALRES